jgi:hypothetical protein
VRAAGRVVAGLAVAAVIASAAGVGPLDLSLLDGAREGRPVPEEPGPTYPGMASAPPSRPDGIDWPARGDLVDDQGFVDRAMTRVREFRPEASRLYFAGTLPDGSRLVLAGTDVSRGIVATAVHALWIRSGTDVDQASVTEGAALTDPQQVLAWAGPVVHSEVVVVAMARPGPVRFEISETVRFGRESGTPARAWREYVAPDGVTVAAVGREADPVVAVRARGLGAYPEAFLVRVATGRRPATVIAVDGTDNPGYRGPDQEQVATALHAGAGAVVDLDQARASVLWSGVPWRHRRLALVLVTRADGQRFQVLVGQDADRAFAAGTRALPAGADPQTPWLLQPFSSIDPTLLLCPTGPGTLVYSRPGRADRILPVNAEGVAPLVEPGPSPPSTSGAGVTLLDPSGRLLLSTVLPEVGFDDPLALS